MYTACESCADSVYKYDLYVLTVYALNTPFFYVAYKQSNEPIKKLRKNYNCLSTGIFLQL